MKVFGLFWALADVHSIVPCGSFKLSGQMGTVQVWIRLGSALCPGHPRTSLTACVSEPVFRFFVMLQRELLAQPEVSNSFGSSFHYLANSSFPHSDLSPCPGLRGTAPPSLMLPPPLGWYCAGDEWCQLFSTYVF